MIEPKRGKHCDFCLQELPSCKCNTCQRDYASPFGGECCTKKHRGKLCGTYECHDYLADEPTKKGADHE